MGMDQFQMSFTTESRRNSSQIYQDLRSCRTATILDIENRTRNLFGEGTTKFRSKDPHHHPHVCIIGAGVAGLRCAEILLLRGFEVTIFEGRDRIGGRMTQAYIPGTDYLVDVGPNWIHGTEGNPIMELAKETGTITHSWGENSHLYNENGNRAPPWLAEEINNHMWDIIIEAFKRSHENEPPIPIKTSLYDWFQFRVYERLPDSDPSSAAKRKLILQLSEAFGAFIGAPVWNQSLKYFWMEETVDGDNLFCANTYQKLLNRIAKVAVEEAEIKFNTTVLQIKSSPDLGGQVEVFTDGIESFKFDEVVVTAPLGWLKKHKDAFIPPLPHRFAEAIDKIGYGTLDKVFITFSEAYWTSYNYRGFTQWLCPNYPSENTTFWWNQEAIELASLPDMLAHPTLLFYIFGDQSECIAHMLETHPPEEHHSVLVEFFRPYFSRLPGYNEDSEGCQPVASFATRWVDDELAGNGSYCYLQAGQDNGDQDVMIMRDGLPSRGVWFAGEHTAPFAGLATVTGAYWSGENVGRMIGDAYGVSSTHGLTMSENIAPSPDNSSSNEGQEKLKEFNVRGFADEGLKKYVEGA